MFTIGSEKAFKAIRLQQKIVLNTGMKFCTYSNY
jgi:hypothetical protein